MFMAWGWGCYGTVEKFWPLLEHNKYSNILCEECDDVKKVIFSEASLFLFDFDVKMHK